MILNITRDVILARNAQELRSVCAQMKGLIFSKPLRDKGLIFVFNSSKRRGIHTFFVFGAIDVLYLDDDRQVIEMKHMMKPYSLYQPKHPSRCFIEFSAGTLNRTNCKLGDHISWKA